MVLIDSPRADHVEGRQHEPRDSCRSYCHSETGKRIGTVHNVKSTSPDAVPSQEPGIGDVQEGRK